MSNGHLWLPIANGEDTSAVSKLGFDTAADEAATIAEREAKRKFVAALERPAMRLSVMAVRTLR